MGNAALITKSQSFDDNTEEINREWKVHLSRQEARDKFIKDGTLNQDSSEDHIELRLMLDDVHALSALGKYAKEKLCLEIFLCWIELQEYNNIPNSKEERKLAKFKFIFETFIERGATKEYVEGSIVTYKESEIENYMTIGEIHSSEREQFRKTIELSCPAADKLQLLHRVIKCLQQRCFAALYNNIYLPFCTTVEYKRLQRRLRCMYNQVTPDDFEYYRKIGEGAFGLVVHCKKKSTGKHYAMKLQHKRLMMVSFKHKTHMLCSEKDALAQCQHPLIINLDYAFQTENLAMIVLGLGTAGDLNHAILSSPERRLNLKRVKFYAAEIVVALSYLHKLGLVYRDLKPQNVLLHEDGHIQLVDMGGVADESCTKLKMGQQIANEKGSDTFTPIMRQIGQSLKERDRGKDYDIAELNLLTREGLKVDVLDTIHTLDSQSSDWGDGEVFCEDADLLFRHDNTKLPGSNYSSDNSLAHSQQSNIQCRTTMTETTQDISTSRLSSLLKSNSKNRRHLSSDTNSGTGEWENAQEKNRKPQYVDIMGTFGYMAPEMVQLFFISPEVTESAGYTSAVDWWSFGCTLYKMLVGSKPFSNQSCASFIEMATNTKNHLSSVNRPEYWSLFQKIYFPDDLPDSAVDIITQLLNVDETRRLGAHQVGGVSAIKQHPFFEGVDWELIEKKQVQPPYQPQTKAMFEGLKPHANFHSFMVSCEKEDWLPTEDGISSVNPIMKEEFSKWDFISDQAMRVELGLSRGKEQLHSNIKVRTVLGG